MRWHVFSRMTWRGQRWFFRLRARNGEIILQSEAYKNRVSAMRTVELIKMAAGDASTFVEPTPQ